MKKFQHLLYNMTSRLVSELCCSFTYWHEPNGTVTHVEKSFTTQDADSDGSDVVAQNYENVSTYARTQRACRISEKPNLG